MTKVQVRKRFEALLAQALKRGRAELPRTVWHEGMWIPKSLTVPNRRKLERYERALVHARRGTQTGKSL